MRHVLHQFKRSGLPALQRRSRAPHQTSHTIVEAARRKRLRALLHQSPRTVGYPSRVWTLPLAAPAAYAEGIIPRQVNGEAIRQALQQLRSGWKRAKQ